jgi:hypothetical protein
VALPPISYLIKIFCLIFTLQPIQYGLASLLVALSSLRKGIWGLIHILSGTTPMGLLSLYNVSEFYQVAMDTMHSKTMTFHVNNNSTINFAPTANGLWVHHVDNPQTVQDMLSMLSTVSDKNKLFTKWAYKHAIKITKIYHAAIYTQLSGQHHQLYGRLSGHQSRYRWQKISLDQISDHWKGKQSTVNNHVLTGIDPVPKEIVEIYCEVTIALDITFVNKVPFSVAMACGIKFGTIEALANQQIQTVRDCLKKVARLYVMRGFSMTSILADN